MWSAPADAAVREWEAALAAEHDYTPAAEAIGELCLAREQYKKAQPYFRRVLAFDPNHYSAHFNLGLVEEHLGDRTSAIKEIEAACKIVPD